jgi:hypothetical protein
MQFSIEADNIDSDSYISANTVMLVPVKLADLSFDLKHRTAFLNPF